MYDIKYKGEDWRCPLCKNWGLKVNKFYGICLNHDCLTVTTEGSTQDIRMHQRVIRKVETVVINQGKNETGAKTRFFYTDGSGIKLKKDSVI